MGARSLPHRQTGSPFPSLLALYRGYRGWGTPGDELGTIWGPAPPRCCAACCRPRAATPQLSSEPGAGWCRGDARVCARIGGNEAIKPALNPPASPVCAPGAFLEGVFSAGWAPGAVPQRHPARNCRARAGSSPSPSSGTLIKDLGCCSPSLSQLLNSVPWCGGTP